MVHLDFLLKELSSIQPSMLRAEQVLGVQPSEMPAWVLPAAQDPSGLCNHTEVSQLWNRGSTNISGMLARLGEGRGGWVVNLGAGDSACRSGLYSSDALDPANCLLQDGRGGVVFEGSPETFSELEQRYKDRADVDLRLGSAEPGSAARAVRDYADAEGGREGTFQLLKVDVDNCDCCFVEAILATGLRPWFVHIEVSFFVPPPIVFQPVSFARGVNDSMEELGASTHRRGHMLHCSLSAVIDLLYPLGYTLLSVVVADAVFVQRSIWAELGRGDTSDQPDGSGDLQGAEGPSIHAEWLAGTYCHPAWPHEAMVVRMQSEFVYDYRLWSDAHRPLYERLGMIRSYLDHWDVPRSRYHLRLSTAQGGPRCDQTAAAERKALEALGELVSNCVQANAQFVDPEFAPSNKVLYSNGRCRRREADQLLIVQHYERNHGRDVQWRRPGEIWQRPDDLMMEFDSREEMILTMRHMSKLVPWRVFQSDPQPTDISQICSPPPSVFGVMTYSYIYADNHQLSRRHFEDQKSMVDVTLLLHPTSSISFFHYLNLAIYELAAVAIGPTVSSFFAASAAHWQDAEASGSEHLLPLGVGAPARDYPSAGLLVQSRRPVIAVGFREVASESVWNTENGLRQGDNVAVGLPHQFSSAHPNEWSLSGAMKIGWKEVGGQGAHFRGLGGVGETRHHQQALSILAGGLQEAHGHAFSTWLDGLPDGAVLHIERHYDPTQLFLSFGAMAQDLQESARYLIPDPDVEGQWKAAFPGKGIVEFMAQTVEVVAAMPDGRTTDARRLVVAPSILKRANASTVFESVEKAVPEMTIDKVQALAAKHQIVLYSEVPDNHIVNKRKRAATAAMLPSNVLAPPMGCAAHLLWRGIVGVMAEDKIVGDIHAVWFTTRRFQSRRGLSIAAQAIASEFNIVPGPPPNAEWARHIDTILEQTILRTMSQVSGRVERIPLPAHDEMAELLADQPGGRRSDQEYRQRRVAVTLVKTFLNGDPRVRGRGARVHYCNGCCASEEAAKAMGEQLAGDMIMGILPEALSRAFPATGRKVRAEQGLGADDFREVIRSKRVRAVQKTNTPGHMQQTAVLSFALAPADNLWMKLQYLDANCPSLKDLNSSRTNPFEICLLEISESCLGPYLDGPASVVFYTYSRGPDDHAQLCAQFQGAFATLACEIHSRFHFAFQSYPYRLLKLVDVRVSQAEKDALWGEFWNAPECDLDEFFSLRLRKMYPSLEAMKDDVAVTRALDTWARTTTFTNMSTERLLALFKNSTPVHHPTVERLAGTSLLTQVLASHLAAGGLDPRRAPSRKELLEAHVPLRCAKKARGKPRGARGAFACVRSKPHDKALPWKEVRRQRLRAFAALPNEERARFHMQEEAAREQQLGGAVDEEERYSRSIGNKLLGLSSRGAPIQERNVLEAMQRLAAPPAATGGVRRMSEPLRSAFQRRLVVSDCDGIPKDLHVSYRQCCGVAHPGLCPTADPALHALGIEAREAIVGIFQRVKFKRGQLFMLTSMPAHIEYIFQLGAMSFNEPRGATVLMLERCAAGVRLQACAGRLVIKEISEVIAAALRRLPGQTYAEHWMPNRLADDRRSRYSHSFLEPSFLSIHRSFLSLPAGDPDGLELRPLQVACPEDAASLRYFEVVGEGDPYAGFHALSRESACPTPPPKKKPKCAVECPSAEPQSESDVDDDELLTHVFSKLKAKATAKKALPQAEAAPPLAVVPPAPPVPLPPLVPPPPPAPADPAAAAAAPGPEAPAPPKEKRAIPWGPARYRFNLARVFSQGVQIGWGATCGRHCDGHVPDPANPDAAVPGLPCKKQLTYGKERLTDEQCVHRLKYWLLVGLRLPISATMRRDHISMDIRHGEPGSSIEEVERLIAA
ncbi:unnamed protein product [Prorocentrum cordatum]|uniref:Calmodulin n=1 Tax=Prorocentrum cordatum TaxID=2364126 RepID=A0ABN9PXS2_9DINO|nr:unnamed protein product [Polarella glacialis]